MTERRDFELYVFDWDGTIMDTTYLIARGMQEAARALGLQVPELDLARSAIGLGLADTMKLVCPDCPRQRWDEFGIAYRQWYICREQEVRLFPNLHALLVGMHANGKRLAIATGKSRGGLNRVFDHTGVRGLFEATRTADESFSKPNPAMLFELSDETGVSCADMVMIGDSIHDLQMAANAGAAAVGVTYGASPRKDLESLPNIGLVDNVLELSETLGVTQCLTDGLRLTGESV